MSVAGAAGAEHARDLLVGVGPVVVLVGAAAMLGATPQVL